MKLGDSQDGFKGKGIFKKYKTFSSMSKVTRESDLTYFNWG